MKSIITSLGLLFFAVTTAHAADELALPAVSGYDVVAYFEDNQAVKGSGFHETAHEGQMYIFSSAENKKKFAQNPTKYLPQFGGWCAYGVSVGKKFYVDPTVFEVVDGKLYLNLDKEIQKKWNEDKAKAIETANTNWAKIEKEKSASL